MRASGRFRDYTPLQPPHVPFGTPLAKSMNQESLKKPEALTDVEEPRRSIEAMCVPFGMVRAIRLLPVPRDREYPCLVEIDSPNRHASLIDTPGGIDVGASVAFRIPFQRAGD